MLDLGNGGYGIGFGDAGLLDMKVVPFFTTLWLEETQAHTEAEPGFERPDVNWGFKLNLCTYLVHFLL